MGPRSRTPVAAVPSGIEVITDGDTINLALEAAVAETLGWKDYTPPRTRVRTASAIPALALAWALLEGLVLVERGGPPIMLPTPHAKALTASKARS